MGTITSRLLRQNHLPRTDAIKSLDHLGHTEHRYQLSIFYFFIIFHTRRILSIGTRLSDYSVFLKKNLAKIAGQHFEFHDVFYLIPLESQSFLLYLRSFWLSSIEEQFFTAFSIKPVRGHRNRIQSLWRNKCETFNSWLLGFLNKSQC